MGPVCVTVTGDESVTEPDVATTVPLMPPAEVEAVNVIEVPVVGNTVPIPPVTDQENGAPDAAYPPPV
jgi:hypothetical protein